MPGLRKPGLGMYVALDVLDSPGFKTPIEVEPDTVPALSKGGTGF